MTRDQAIAVLLRTAEALTHQLPPGATVQFVAVEVKQT